MWSIEETTLELSEIRKKSSKASSATDTQVVLPKTLFSKKKNTIFVLPTIQTKITNLKLSSWPAKLPQIFYVILNLDKKEKPARTDKFPG